MLCEIVVPDESNAQRGDDGPIPSWNDEGGFDGSFDDENDYGEIEESSSLVSQPRQVGFIPSFAAVWLNF